LAYRKKKSLEIEKRLWGLEAFRRALLVMFYVSIGSEVKTRKMIKRALKEGKKVAVPFIGRSGSVMKAVTIGSFEKDLAKGYFGIPEPRKSLGKSVAAGKIDIVIVPAVACDKSCNRIGYGGGYYDRWLKNIPCHKTIGLAFERQVVEKISKSSNDIPLGQIVTEKRIIERS
jgi:5-formyltetrahydrofolate cyclo-ligase